MDGILEETQQTTDEPRVDEPESMDELIRRHRSERKAAIARVEREQRAAETEQLDALNDNIAKSLVTVIDELRKRIRDDRAESRLVAHVALQRPHGADQLQRLADATGPGERAALLMIPQGDAYGSQEKRAWLLIDCSADVWR